MNAIRVSPTQRLLLTVTALVLVVASPSGLAQTFVENSAVQLTGVAGASVAWGDYNNDQHLDIVVAGAGSSSMVCKLYRNNGNSTFTPLGGTPFTGVYLASVAWGDYDNDGYLDLLVTGIDNNWTIGTAIAKVYRNNGNGTFSEKTSVILTPVFEGSVAWGDYDNDGKLDILLTGLRSASGSAVAKVYRNNGNHTFTEQRGIALTPVHGSSVAWGDYDNDGYLDILLTGLGSGGMPVAKLYRNNGDSTFSEVTAANLTGVGYSSVAWGDYDNDGYLDILLAGDSGSSQAAPVCKVYRNNHGNGSFTEQLGFAMTGVYECGVAWGDYNNDGYLDILITGLNRSNAPVSKVYHNDRNGFCTEDTLAMLTPVGFMSSVAWGDYNEDGKLDILLAGGRTNGSVTKLYRNDFGVVNQRPNAPTGLTVVRQGSQIRLSWQSASDSKTPYPGLSYNLRIGTTPGGSDILGPMAAADGTRRIVKTGPIQGTSWTLNAAGLAAPVYYWSVQAIDTAFAGSPFAAEQTFAGATNTPGTPTGVWATDGVYCDRVCVGWNSSSGAGTYEVWRDIAPGGTDTAARIASGLASTLYCDTLASAGVTYTYWVRAVSPLGAVSPFSDGDSGFTSSTISLPKPTGVSATDGSHCGWVGVTWNRVTGATAYEVYRDGLSIAANIVATNFVDTPGDILRHSYQVRARSEPCGLSELSDADPGWAKASPQAPANVRASDGTYCDHVHVGWDSAGLATAYEVYRDGIRQTPDATGLSYDDWPGDTATHSYTVKAKNDCGTSGFSGADSGYAGTALSPPTSVAASYGAYNDHIEVSWAESAGATGYQVWRGTDTIRGNATNHWATSGTNYSDWAITQCTTYYYWVQATNACSANNFSGAAMGLAGPVPAVPTGLTASDGLYKGAVHVTWDGLPGLTYEVWRNSTNDLNGASRLASNAVSPFDDYGWFTAPLYYYWVRVNGTCGKSGYSTPDTGYPAGCADLDAPAPLFPVCGEMTPNGPVTLTWTPVTNALGYSVRVYGNEFCSGSALFTTNTPPEVTSAALTLAAGQSYSWQVRANGDGGEYCNSSWSSCCPLTVSNDCSYSISSADSPFSWSGGTGTVAVATGPSCGWSAANACAWVTILSLPGACRGQVCSNEAGVQCGCGPGFITYRVDANSATNDRSCLLTIAWQDFVTNITVTQEASNSTARLIHALDSASGPRGTLAVPIELEALGTEHAVRFSVLFDPSLLAFLSAAKGSGASTAALDLNPTQLLNGRAGVALTLPPGKAFPAGNQRLLNLNFAVMPGSAPATTAVRLANEPTAREVVDVLTNTLPANYLGAVVTLTSMTNADLRRPAITISVPVAGQRVSNVVFTVKGTAKDDAQVATVRYRMNQEAWGAAWTTNGWTNWTARVTLWPGTNTVRAYAEDAAGNKSPTNTVSFRYVVSDRLTLVINPPGWGTVTGATNGQMIEIGSKRTAMAKANSGFAFVNWMQATNGTDWVTSTVPTLNFTMRSNLVLRANFGDMQKPTLGMSPPTANQRWSNSIVRARGTAKDNVQVTAVWWQTNGGPWTLASTTNSWTNWTVDLTLSQRTNTMQAYAVDGAGNKCTTNSARFFYVMTDRLVVITNGNGKVSPNYNNAVLEIGVSYSMTAANGPGFVFSNWVGSVLGATVMVSNTPKLTFTMRSNLVLQASFVPNPFIVVKGTYNGLFAETNRAQESSGFFTLTLTDKGAFSGSLKRGTNSYPLGGQFDVAGTASKTVIRPKTNPWQLSMQLDFGVEQLQGTVSNGVVNGWVAELLADRAVFSRTNPAPYAGKYTLVIPGLTNADGTVATGDGYAVLTVDTNGGVSLSGSLADGTALIRPSSQNPPVSRDGDWPLYVPLYSGKGSVWGWLAFETNQSLPGVEGGLSWIKLAGAGGKYYPLGLTNEVRVEGSRYTPPLGPTNRAIALTNGVLLLEGGHLSVPLTNFFLLTQTNKVIDLSVTNRLTLTLTVSNGLFNGKIRVPETGKTNAFNGVLLQNEAVGSGYFLGTNQSGRVSLEPQ